jgi:hypothetical protein
MASEQDEYAKRALDHGWSWFALHAAQRMQTFNFFLIATAFLVAAYASLLDKDRWAATVIALLGGWIAFWFTRLDIRTKQLVEAGEAVLRSSQKNLAQKTETSQIEIVQSVERPVRGTWTYSVIIPVIEWTVVAVFVLCAIYASPIKYCAVRFH